MKPINIVMAACVLSWFGTGAAQQDETSQTEASEEQAQHDIPATPHQQEVLRETTSDLFERLDADGDGLISREEAEADPSLASRWTEYDQDGDGKLSQEEFAAFEQRSTSSAESEAPDVAPREPAEGDIPATPHQEQVLRDDQGDEAQSDERLRTEWDELDRNEDGELDESELSELEE
jgi:Ca2+-binding EF-hand superfamily protein